MFVDGRGRNFRFAVADAEIVELALNTDFERIVDAEIWLLLCSHFPHLWH